MRTLPSIASQGVIHEKPFRLVVAGRLAGAERWPLRSPRGGDPQETFATPEAAVDALMAALKADSDAPLVALFGEEHKAPHRARPRGGEGEPRAGSSRRCRRCACSRSRAPTAACSLIGDQAWPVPIPIVKAGDRWRFATEEGVEELINRRIGGNERNAIYVVARLRRRAARLCLARP